MRRRFTSDTECGHLFSPDGQQRREIVRCLPQRVGWHPEKPHAIYVLEGSVRKPGARLRDRRSPWRVELGQLSAHASI